MTAIDEFNPTPQPDYDGLLFQFRALCRLYNSTRDQCSFMAKTICDLNKRIADGSLDAVDSERAANAKLTAEVEALRQERDELQARVAAIESAQAKHKPDTEMLPAPTNSLPDWKECALRVGNSKYIAERVAGGGFGAEPDSLLANELHQFIYEYDDADPYKSAWFLHRLEKTINFVKAEAVLEACDNVSAVYACVPVKSEFDNGFEDGVKAVRQYANQIEGGE